MNIILKVVFLVLPLIVLAQQKVLIEGVVIDSANKTMQFELLFYSSDSLHVKLKTDSTGYFYDEIPVGDYEILVNSLDSLRRDTLRLSKKVYNSIDFGVLSFGGKKLSVKEFLEPPKENESLSILTVRKKLFSQENGKKIYDVSQDITAKTGTVLGVLENVPSVQVDQDGNVTVRGQSVQILINGKQSGVTGSGGQNSNLQNISAAQIERIEVDNNPSAKNDAEGKGGLVNIVLKKEERYGFRATLNIYSGVLTNSGLDFNWNSKNKLSNIYGSFSGRYREPQSDRTYSSVFFDLFGARESGVEQRSNRIKETLDFNFNIGAEYELTEKQTLELSGFFSNSNQENTSRIFYDDFDASNTLFDQSNRNEIEDEDRFTFEGNAGYTIKFNGNNHQLNVSGLASFTEETERSDIPELRLFSLTDPIGLTSQDKTSNDESRRNFVAQADYALPLRKDELFEAGLKYINREKKNDILVSQKDLMSGSFITNANFTGITRYDENIFAAYAQYKNKTDLFSFSSGLRIEKSNIILTQAQRQRNIYTDFFPSVFVGYKVTRTNQLSLNYTRRVSRPFDFFLTPFFTFSDDRNTFVGNPGLQPSYTDKIELGYNFKPKKTDITTSVYFSNEDQPFQVVRTLETLNNPITGPFDIFVAKPINVDNRKQYGVELTSTYSFAKKWRVIAVFNGFGFDQQGDFNGQNFGGKGLNFTTQLTIKGELPYKTNLQISSNYKGREDTNQIVRKGVFFAKIGLTKSAFNDKATFALNVNDVFNSRRLLIESFGEDFQSDVDIQFSRRQIDISFTYRFNPAPAGSKEKNVKTRGIQMEGGF